MRFQWDPRKARRNELVHGVDFADAVLALEDPLALTGEDPHPSEERFLTIGLDDLGRVLVISWTWREQDIRLISARRATPRERDTYAAQD